MHKEQRDAELLRGTPPEAGMYKEQRDAEPLRGTPPGGGHAQSVTLTLPQP